MWDYVFTCPKNPRAKGSTSRAPFTTSNVSLPTLPNSTSSQYNAHFNNSNVSCLRNGSLAGPVCYEAESVGESGTPSSQLTDVPEMEEHYIDDSEGESGDSDREMEDDGIEASVGFIRDGPGLQPPYKPQSMRGKKGEKGGKEERKRFQPDLSLTGGELNESLITVVEKHGDFPVTTTREERLQFELERIRHLWTEQSVTNSGVGHPWTKQWHNLFIALHRVTEQRRKENHVDEMIDTIFEGYQTRNQIQHSYGHYFQRGTLEALRDMVSQSFGLYNLFRDDNQRMVTLSELAALELEEGDRPRQTRKKGPKKISGRHDFTAEIFLRLLEYLAESFLQDAVHWKARYPNHFIWRHPLFHCPQWLEFEQYARRETALAEEDLVVLPPSMRQTMPGLLQGFQMLSSNQRKFQMQMGASFNHLREEVAASIGTGFSDISKTLSAMETRNVNTLQE
ncbi:hypothetical protein C365_00714 [Cryptococcus neoformans Bt85]|nr:hypothetical protein C365_00714 [Cryptococcus neoformans var. grubii Bt85]OXM81745.1 hypothetical protein C364_00717 [Cryptococcus neoformans var. grubii Bt63]